MDGRWTTRLLAAAVMTGAVGCNITKTVNAPPAPPNLGSGTMLSRALAPKPPGPVPQLTPVAAETPKGPIKADTAAGFAEIQVEAAYLSEETPSADRDRMLDEARTKFQNALKQDPKSLVALRGLARLYTRCGDRDRAVQMYQTALTHYPKDHKLAHEAALSLGRFEEWTGAAAACEHAMAVDPENRRYPRTLGICQTRLGKYEDGFATLMRVMPETEARVVMARELNEAGQGPAARQQVELAIKADPANAAAREMLATLEGRPLSSGVSQAQFQGN